MGAHVPGVELGTDLGGLPVVWEDYSTGALDVVAGASPYGDRAARITTSAAAGEASVLRAAVPAGGSEVAVSAVLTVPSLASGQWMHVLRVSADGTESGYTLALVQDGRAELACAWTAVHATAAGALPAAGTRLRVALALSIGGGSSTWRLSIVNDETEAQVTSGSGTAALAGAGWGTPRIGKTTWESGVSASMTVHTIRVDQAAGAGSALPVDEPYGQGLVVQRKGSGPVTLRRAGTGRVGVNRRQHPSIPAGVTGDWTILKEDTFTTLDTAVWTTLRGAPGGLYGNPYNSDLDGYGFAADRATVTDGQLRLAWDPAPITVSGTTYPYTAGMAHTGNGAWTFTPPVYIEASIHVPDTPGLWPAFWMLPTPVDDHWPPEIDIAEWVQDDTPDGRIHPHFNYHWNDGTNQQAGWQWYGTRGRSEAGAFRTYGLLWQPGRIQAFLDRVPGPVVSGAHVTSAPMYLVLSTGVRKDATPAAGAMLVDWVRVWTQSG